MQGLIFLFLIFFFLLVFAPLPVEMTLIFVQDHAQPLRSSTDQSLSVQTIVPGALSGFSPSDVNTEVFSIWLPTDTSRNNISLYINVI